MAIVRYESIERLANRVEALYTNAIKLVPTQRLPVLWAWW